MNLKTVFQTDNTYHRNNDIKFDFFKFLKNIYLQIENSEVLNQLTPNKIICSFSYKNILKDVKQRWT